MSNLSNSNNKLSICELSKLWIRYNQNSFKPNTLQKYRSHIDKYINSSSLSNKCVSDISSMDLAEFSDNLLDLKLSNNTVNDILLVLGSLIKYAHEFHNDNLIAIPFVREESKEMRVLSQEEQYKLEKYIKSNVSSCGFGVLFALYTGVRIGELCALQWKDIDNGHINIHKTMYRVKMHERTSVVIASPKTVSSFRIIPLPSFLNDYIERFRQEDDSYILGSDRTPLVEPRLMQLRFKKITDELNFADVTFHTLRHTFATRCVECGFDIKSLSEILGHSNIKTTLGRYVHSSMEQKQLNMNKLERIAV